MQGSSAVHFGRGLAARDYFTYRDVLGFIYAQAKFQLLGKENSDDVAAGRRKALTFIEGRSVEELVALGEEIYDEIIADKIWSGHPRAHADAPRRRPAGLADHRHAIRARVRPSPAGSA